MPPVPWVSFGERESSLIIPHYVANAILGDYDAEPPTLLISNVTLSRIRLR